MRKQLITCALALCMALANPSQAGEINAKSDNDQALKAFKTYTSRSFPPELLSVKLVHKGDKRA
ncbi:hypothetical protein [Methylobacter sp. BBA5.1]|jgi:hypothetical protein|uniref:hypothetical protein n=1 Tax=Methylobacter sp. BBA5.1 TaxID=1495064 RepID=UPI00055CAD47|nr:hypothetical protein [Methylobacter sp. BBA5.1]